MTATTIKVSSDLRDRLKSSAAAHGRTLGAHLEVLLAEEARRERFARLRRQVADVPPDERYRLDLAAWEGEEWT